MNINSVLPKMSILLFLFCYILNIQAQTNLLYLIGQVRDASSYETISYALVKNSMSNKSVIADENGRFIISITRGDLIRVSAIGFEDGFYIINDTLAIINDFPIQLKPKIYELKEVTLTPYKTVLQFKHAFAQLTLPDENLMPELKLPESIQALNQSTPGELGPVVINGPISILYNAFSHRGKMEKKYRNLISSDKESESIQIRFRQVLKNSYILFETDDELLAFIGFCKFDINFILNASDYELIAEIQKKYEEYTQVQQL